MSNRSSRSSPLVHEWQGDFQIQINQIIGSGNIGKTTNRISVRQKALWGGTGFGLGFLLKTVLSLIN